MKKTEPKIILNLSVENDELDKVVKLAIDKYVEQSVYAQLDNTIEKIVDKRIDKLIKRSIPYDFYYKHFSYYCSNVSC